MPEVDTKNLILSVITFIKQDQGTLTKTKLVKYLYLLDVEYYRKHRRTLTNLPWIYYKYGPYAHEFEDAYEELQKGQIKVKKVSGDDYDAEIVNVRTPIPLEEVQPDPEIRILLKANAARWNKALLAELLSFVYNDTEPMLNAKRNELLDFGKIPPKNDEEFYYRKKSGLTNSKIKRLQKKFRENITEPVTEDETVGFINNDVINNNIWKDIKGVE